MAAASPLTHLESRVLSAIDQHITHHGQSPTIAELALALRLKSKGTVHRYVQSLIEKGKLERHGSGWRGLRIAGKPVVDQTVVDQSMVNQPIANQPLGAEAGSNVQDFIKLPAERISSGDFRIPLLGKIAAGQPIEAIEDQVHLDLAEFFIGPDRYALRVSGDSMIDVGILDGDTVILRKTNKVRSGDIVVALIDSQEATLKRLGQYEDGQSSGSVSAGLEGGLESGMESGVESGVESGIVELIPENKTMSTMRYSSDRVSFQGVLVGQLRSY